MSRLIARTLLIHTGGVAWIDVIGMQGVRHEPFVQWLPTSPRVELGMAPAALTGLPFLRSERGRRLSHFVAHLDGGTSPPSGGSAHLAVSLAVLWYWHASSAALSFALPGAPPAEDTPRIVLTGSGTLRQVRDEAGLFRYEIAAVDDWEDKLARLARFLSDRPVEEAVIFAPLEQASEVTTALRGCMPDLRGEARGRWSRPGGPAVRLELVETMHQLDRIVQGLVRSRRPGPSEDLGARLERAYQERRELQLQGGDTTEVDAEIREIRRRIRDGLSLEPGDLLGGGRFELIEVIGEGGFATVWKAYDLRDREVVAIKVLHGRWARNPDWVARFFRGARHMARLQHPGVARIIEERGRDGPHHWFAMEYVHGRTLHDAVIAGEVGGCSGLEIVVQVTDALEHAHREGLVHRDVKPRNVLLRDEGQPVLVDFGLARAAETLAGTSLTTFGTLLYAAPEVLRDGPEQATERADVYALGMTALFVVHGEELPIRAVRSTDEFIAELGCADPIKWELARALEAVPAARHPSAADFGGALQEAMRPRHPAPTPPFVPPRERVWNEQRRRLRGGAIAGLILAGIALAVAGVHLVQRWTSDAETRVALARGATERTVEARQLEARAWRQSDRHPGRALALLRASDTLTGEASLDIGSADRLGAAGARSFVVPMPSEALAVEAAPGGETVAVGTLGGTLHWIDVATGQELGQHSLGFRGIRGVGWLAPGLAAGWTTNPDMNPGSLVVVDLERARRVLAVPVGGQQPYVALGGEPGTSWVGSEQGVVGWEVASGRPRFEYDAPRDSRLLGLDGEQGFLLLQRGDGPVYRVDPRTGSRLGRLAGSAGVRWRAGLSAPGARRIALQHSDGVGLWDGTSQELLFRQELPADFRWAFASDGRSLAVGARDGSVLLVDAVAGRRLAHLDGHSARLAPPVFTPDGRFLATGDYNGEIRVWAAGDGAPVRVMRGHGAHVHGMAFAGSPADPVLVTASLDETVRLWPGVTRPPGSDEAGIHLASDQRAVLASNGRQVAIAPGDAGRIRVMDLAGAQAIEVQAGRPLTSLEWAADGSSFTAAMGGDPKVWWWDRDGRLRLERRLEATRALPSSSGRLLALAGGEGLRIWDAVEDRITHRWIPHRGVARDLAFFDEDTHLAAVDRRGGLHVWDLSEGGVERLVVSDMGARVLAPAPDGRAVAAGGRPGSVGIWPLDPDAPPIYLDGHEEDVVAMAFSPDGSLLATGSWDDTAVLWDRTGRPVQRLTGHETDVQAVAFSPDGTRLATGDKSGAIRFWEVPSGTLLGAVYTVGGAVRQLRFASDDILVSVSPHAVRTWTVPEGRAGDLLRRAGAWTNLRVCRGTHGVVPVLPFPDPASAWAPAEACPSADDGTPAG